MVQFDVNQNCVVNKTKMNFRFNGSCLYAVTHQGPQSHQAPSPPPPPVC